MPLTTAIAAIVPGDPSVNFLVPGHEVWSPRSIFAIADRGAGGAPNRSYTLVVTDGTNIVAQVGADDAGAEPGTCDITFANAPAASVSAGTVGISLAPLAPFRLPAGYTLTVNINNAVAGDTWVFAACWYDFVLSG